MPFRRERLDVMVSEQSEEANDDGQGEAPMPEAVAEISHSSRVAAAMDSVVTLAQSVGGSAVAIATAENKVATAQDSLTRAEASRTAVLDDVAGNKGALRTALSELRVIIDEWYTALA